jgi:uncharacterized hydrophobic protein (TIGR00271 family)
MSVDPMRLAARAWHVVGKTFGPMPHRSDDTIVRMVRENSEPSRVYWLMNALATLIACYGLLANSTAVVIGAMVVAMLLGPISGVALGLNQGNRPLLRLALWSLIGGIIWILCIATVIGLIHRDVPLTYQILSRTDPGLFDLVIALAGGSAGAVAVVSPRIGTAIVGVAVATALVPPLSAAGLLFARGEFSLGGGALLLALTNVIAIEVAFSAVFWVNGYHHVRTDEDRGLLPFVRRNGLSLGMLGGLAVLLGVQLHQAISKALFESEIKSVIRQRFVPDLGFYLTDLRVSNESDSTVIRAVLRGPWPPTAAQVAAAQDELTRAGDGRTVELRVRFIHVTVMTAHGELLIRDPDATGQK